MPKCVSCKKEEAHVTRWERIRGWLAYHLFPIDFKDEATNARLEGFAQGYKIGREHQKEVNKLEYL